MPYSSVGNPFLWTGHRYDPAVGLYHTLFRTYSPTLGRWLQRDPKEYVDGFNLYEYAKSSPIVLFDPLGDTSCILKPPGTGPPPEHEQDKCRAAANKAPSNCLKSEKSGGATAPSKADCFETFSQSMDACARGKPGTHTLDVGGSEYLDCVGRCIDKIQHALAGAVSGKIGVAAAALGTPVSPEMLAKFGLGHVACKAKLLRRLGGAEVFTYQNALSVHLCGFRFLRVASRVAFPIFVGEAALNIAIEATCAADCGDNPNGKYK